MKNNPDKKRAKNAFSNRRRKRFDSHELAFQPWFLPRASRLAINALIPPGYRNKMRFYFDDYGCMICGKRELYDANGMCLPCHHLIRRRLATSFRRHLVGNNPEDSIAIIMKQRATLASRLLAPFAPRGRAKALHYRLDFANLRNPVDGALVFLTPGSRRSQTHVPRNAVSSEHGMLGKSVRDMPRGRVGR